MSDDETKPSANFLGDSDLAEPPDFPKDVSEMSSEDWAGIAKWSPKSLARAEKILSEA